MKSIPDSVRAPEEMGGGGGDLSSSAAELDAASRRRPRDQRNARPRWNRPAIRVLGDLGMTEGGAINWLRDVTQFRT